MFWDSEFLFYGCVITNTETQRSVQEKHRSCDMMIRWFIVGMYEYLLRFLQHKQLLASSEHKLEWGSSGLWRTKNTSWGSNAMPAAHKACFQTTLQICVIRFQAEHYLYCIYFTPLNSGFEQRRVMKERGHWRVSSVGWRRNVDIDVWAT
jgi:hypothetical protein